MLLFVLIWTTDGRPAVEKLLLRLASPLCLGWSCLSVALVIALRRGQRWIAGLLAGCWLLLTLGGNGWVAAALVRPLEVDYIDIDPFQEPPLDAAVILGGGLSEAVGGRIQVNQAGDRIVLGARLYHAGLVQHLYCTGTRIESLAPERRDPSRQARMLLRQLGVPDEAITEVAGINTADEMRHLSDELPDARRVGLITSAWHMRRALRQAGAQGIVFVPLPADFATRPAQDRPPGLTQVLLQLLPDSSALETTTAALKEYLALAVGR